ncbi:LytR/AlgR family response regulator transcription factor [Halioglobus pacificus]|uniref:DNA-binding response regulator n=1 Tax=Parahalioglobus pacificus TaxID=930806 RepID=A0A918XJW5_9GAMM|nr:LytTR family DNA-binding domain-containing protein [Halioglobus pacificus]NQY01815.1 response regulator transcription factor [Halieaceae bacterium]GHD34302.1 DNA-binding response regulator [Halioglobus pacificus]
MSTLRAIVVDDENLARRGLTLRLANIPAVELVAECSNGAEALKAIAELSPDLVFLDIQMPGMNGFDVIEHLQSDNMPMIVFVTAFDEFAVDAFKVHAVDYVLKPIDEQRLEEAVNRALAHRAQAETAASKEKLVQLVMGITGASASSVEEMAESSEAPKKWPEKITIRDGNDIRFIRVAEITWVDAAGDYMCIHAGGETHIMRITMKQLEALLNPDVFLRVHRSTIVNTKVIVGAQSLDNGEFLLNLEGDSQVKVSRSYRDKVKHLLVTG